MGNDVFVKDIVYDTQTQKFMLWTYTTREQSESAILDSLGFLPIRKSKDDINYNIYRLKSNKRIEIKIAFTRGDFRTIREYNSFIDKVLAEHNRTRDELVLVKKIVDEALYNRCCKLARTRESKKLLDIYGWKK
jgi:hypothetical protein